MKNAKILTNCHFLVAKHTNKEIETGMKHAYENWALVASDK